MLMNCETGCWRRKCNIFLRRNLMLGLIASVRMIQVKTWGRRDKPLESFSGPWFYKAILKFLISLNWAHNGRKGSLRQNYQDLSFLQDSPLTTLKSVADSRIWWSNSVRNNHALLSLWAYEIDNPCTIYYIWESVVKI